jgi:hypothetical protein
MQKSTKSIYLFVNFVRVHYEEVLPKKNKRNSCFLNSKNDLSIIVLDRKEKMETGIEKVWNNYEEREFFNYELEMLIIMLNYI